MSRTKVPNSVLMRHAFLPLFRLKLFPLTITRGCAILIREVPPMYTLCSIILNLFKRGLFAGIKFCHTGRAGNNFVPLFICMGPMQDGDEIQNGGAKWPWWRLVKNVECIVIFFISNGDSHLHTYKFNIVINYSYTLIL